jgi:hypothetical protein
MPLTFLDPSEDHEFQDGETIYDVDGNSYTVKNHRAVLSRENSTVSYFLGRTMKLCFSRTNPKATRS